MACAFDEFLGHILVSKAFVKTEKSFDVLSISANRVLLSRNKKHRNFFYARVNMALAVYFDEPFEQIAEKSDRAYISAHGVLYILVYLRIVPAQPVERCPVWRKRIVEASE